VEGAVAERVLADRCEKRDPGAETGRADRLVRALPAVVAPEQVADPRLAGRRRAVDEKREPDAVAADDRDARHASILGRIATIPCRLPLARRLRRGASGMLEAGARRRPSALRDVSPVVSRRDTAPLGDAFEVAFAEEHAPRLRAFVR